ncbi:MAG: aminopeptidase P family protein [Clostridia bacterium]|nr:aminopeptidase P family protein [Clostridia bacterium]
MEKINNLRRILKNSHEAILIHSPENRRYFTGFPSSDGYLVITQDDAVLFTDSRYIEAAQKKIIVCRTQLLTRLSGEIKAFLIDNNIEKVYTETEKLTVSLLSQLRKIFSSIKLTPSQRLEKLISGMRSKKYSYETECIKKAQAIAEAAFDHILEFIKPGVTEKQIALELDYYMLSHGAEALSFETIAVTGKKTSMPHGVPDDSVVKNGDFVTMDFGAVYNGYHSDMTRTVAVGEVSQKQREIYETVLEAQKAALGVLKSGVECSFADKAARDVIIKAGYGDYFGHATGHGVGIEIHESPNLSPRSENKLESGNVVTVEPGIYLPDEFGVRIEDMAVIEKDGCINLTNAPKELIVL